MTSAFRAVAPFLSLFVVVFGTTVPASTGLTFYSDRASWQAAVNGRTDIDFGLPQEPIAVPPGLTVSGVNFSANPGLNRNGFGVHYDGGSTPTLLALGIVPGAPDGIRVTFPGGGATAIAFNYGVVFFAATVVLSTGESFTLPACDCWLPGTHAFLGFSSSVPITSMQVTTLGAPSGLLFVNFSFSSATASKLTITTTSLPPITAGRAYAASIQAAGGTLPYRWSRGSGSGPLPYLPDNVSFDPAGVISSDPTTRLSAGLYNFTMTVADATGLTATATFDLTVSCGDSERDQVSAQYVSYGSLDLTGTLPMPPVCQDFTRTARSADFLFDELNVTSGSRWALVRLPLAVPASQRYGLDLWVALYQGPGGARTINSAYRTPAHNSDVGGAPDDRHVWGDAVDLKNYTRTTTEWDAMCTAAQQARANYTECQPGDPLSHVHADWRYRTGPYQHGAGGQ